MFYKRFISRSVLAFALAVFFAGGESFSFLGEGSFIISSAEAKDKGKDKDKDKDDDGLGPGDFVYDNDDFSTTLDCSKVKKLQIWYHKKFIATDAIYGPNILVTGSDEDQCTITIKKVSGGNKCGFSARKVGKKIQIDTRPKKNQNNCEMKINVVVPRSVKILG